MLADKALIAFVATTDPAKARTFYQDALGLRFVAETPAALEFDARGTMLRVTRVAPGFIAAPHAVLGWNIEDIRTAVRALKRRGIVFERYEGLNQDQDDLWDSPNGAQVAWFKDPDGNTLSLTQLPTRT